MVFYRLSIVLLAVFFSHAEADSGAKDQIYDAVELALKQTTQDLAENGYAFTYRIKPLDSRLQLKPCAALPETLIQNSPMERASLSVEVSCQQPKPWKLFVNVPIEVLGSVVVSSQVIPRNTPITPDKVEIKQQVINKSAFVGYTAAQDVVSMVAKRTIQQGRVLQSHMLKPPLLVKRGEIITIEAANDSINVRMNGIALSDGQMGQSIAVRNERSQRVVQAKVVAAGVARITL